MAPTEYRRIIDDAIRDLPDEVLAEVADFVLFVRKKVRDPIAYRQEIDEILLRNELDEMSRHETDHLEEEFEEYERHYPRESTTSATSTEACN